MCHVILIPVPQRVTLNVKETIVVRLNSRLLDETRTKLGISSDEKLAAHLGLSRNTIHGLRHGRTAPSAETLLKLRRVTSIPMEDWLIEERPAAKNAA